MMRIGLIIILLLVGNELMAQSKKGDFQFTTKSDVVVDADLDEWGDLILVNPDSTWLFAVAHDQENIYVAVEVADPILQVEAARNGILININTTGKKKDGMILTFPIPDSESVRAMLNDEDLKPENVRKELIERSRGYQVKDFPMLVDGLLSFDNTYGIKAVANVSEQNRLVYEAVIPIEQLRLKNRNSQIALQVSINNRWVQMQRALRERNNHNNRYYRGMMRTPTPQVKTPFKGKTEVWIVDTL